MAHAILLALAGLASGTLPAVLGGYASPISGLLLGAVLAGYLWLHAGVRSSARLGGVVVASVVGHYLVAFLGLVSLFIMAMASSNYANATPSLAVVPAGAAGAAAIAVVFLHALPSEREHLGLEIACCAIAGGLVGFQWELVKYPSFHWLLRLTLWNGAVAGTLGLMAYLRTRPAASRTPALWTLAGVGFTSVVCAVLVFGDTARAAAVDPRVTLMVRQHEVAREARVKSLNEAPPAVDQPFLPQVDARELFAPKPIAGFACLPPENSSLPPDMRPIDTNRLHVPARHLYYVHCYPAGGGPQEASRVTVAVVHYPNDAWARYELRSEDGNMGVIDDRNQVKRITKYGRPIFVGQSLTYWSSGDKVIELSGTAPQQILDAFIEAYLNRYPNTLEPDFDLPYLPQS